MIAGGTVTGGGNHSDIIVANNQNTDTYEIDVTNLAGDLDISRFRLSLSRSGLDAIQLLTDNTIQLTPPDYTLDSGGSNGQIYNSGNQSASIYLSSLELIETPPVPAPLPTALVLFIPGLFSLFGISLACRGRQDAANKKAVH